MSTDEQGVVRKIDNPGEFFTAVRLQSWNQVIFAFPNSNQTQLSYYSGTLSSTGEQRGLCSGIQLCG